MFTQALEKGDVATNVSDNNKKMVSVIYYHI